MLSKIITLQRRIFATSSRKEAKSSPWVNRHSVDQEASQSKIVKLQYFCIFMYIYEDFLSFHNIPSSTRIKVKISRWVNRHSVGQEVSKLKLFNCNIFTLQSQLVNESAFFVELILATLIGDLIHCLLSPGEQRPRKVVELLGHGSMVRRYTPVHQCPNDGVGYIQSFC